MKGNTVLLIIALLLLICTLSISYKNSQQIQELRQENSRMLDRIDSLINLAHVQPKSTNTQVPDSLSEAVNEVAYEMAETGKGIIEFFNAIIEGITNDSDKDSGKETGSKSVNKSTNKSGSTSCSKTKSSTAPIPKIMVVTSKYRMEDRYVRYDKVELPDIKGLETGQVDLTIRIDKFGDVKSAKLKSATGITNEDVIEACKKAALKTKFNSNLDLDGYQAGSITYFFKME